MPDVYGNSVVFDAKEQPTWDDFAQLADVLMFNLEKSEEAIATERGYIPFTWRKTGSQERALWQRHFSFSERHFYCEPQDDGRVLAHWRAYA